MTLRLPRFFTAMLLLVGAVLLGAADSTPQLEKAQALSGYGYTVIGRVFLGDGGNTSYLRFLNQSGNTATVSATLIGSPSGRNYGTTQISIANHASRQVSINDMMSDLGLLGPSSPDDRLGVYLRSDAAPVTVQHVLYSQSTGFFENMTTCQNSSVSDTNSALMNLHTTNIADYTSYVTMYNYATTAAVYDVQVYEATTGAFKGLVTVTIDPNSTFEQPFSWFQDQLQWTPGASEYHANIVAFPQGGSRGALIFHTVYNNKVGVYLNLTNFCTLESSASTLPVANNDNLTGALAGQAFPITFAALTANDQNTSGAALSDTTTPQTNGSTNGTLTQSGNDLTFTPARTGIATFQYRIRSAAGSSSFATVTVNVSDGAPVVENDRLTQTVAVGASGSIPISTLTANDRNTGGATFVIASQPTTQDSPNGTLTQNGDALVYTPARAGTVIFAYQLRNSVGISNIARVVLTAGSTSAAPTANDDTLTQTFTAGQTTAIPLASLTANDVNATDATFAGITTPTTDGAANGSFSTVSGGLTYTPTRPGSVTFTYQLRNGAGLSNAATVRLTVGGSSAAPVAANDFLSQTFTAGQTTTVPLRLLTANDQNANDATLENLTTPTTDGTANGTIARADGGFAYTPARSGTATFTYQIRTSAGLSNAATVTLTVGAAGNAPVAANDTLTQTFTAGQASTILLSSLTANDTNATDATFVSISTPATEGSANGSFITVSGGISYTPARSGTATFTYQLRNSAGLSNVATVRIVIGGTSAPVAVNDTLTQTFTVGQATAVPLSALTANDQNAAGGQLENLTTPVTEGRGNGTIARTDGGFTYTPAISGTATFSYQIRTGAGLSNTATVTLTVTGSSGAPVANSDSLSQTFTVGQQATILLSTLTANDQNVTGATLDSIRQPTTDGAANSTMTAQADRILYTPARAGLVAFGYQLRNGAGLSNAATVVLTVTGAGGVPVATNDTLTLSFTAGQATVIPLTAFTANDLNAADATFASLTTPTTDGAVNGSFSTASGALAYTPARAGTVTLTYQLRNSAGLSNVATVTLTVAPAGAAPVAVNDSLGTVFTVGQTTTVALATLTANDQNIAGGSLENLSTPLSGDGTANGTLTRTDGGFAYTPARAGTVTFTYQIRTSTGLSNAATVVITVRGVN